MQDITTQGKEKLLRLVFKNPKWLHAREIVERRENMGHIPCWNGDLVRCFLRGYAPAGLDRAELDELRLWRLHGPLGWTMLRHPSEEEIRRAMNAVRRSEISDDPGQWF